MSTLLNRRESLTRSLLMINMEKRLVSYGYAITGIEPSIVGRPETDIDAGYKGEFSYTRPDGTEMTYHHETSDTSVASVSELMAWRENITRTELDAHLTTLLTYA